LLGLLGATIGGYLGWWLGAHAGIFVAFIVSVVGTGGGLHLGRRVSARYLPLIVILLVPAAPALSSQQLVSDATAAGRAPRVPCWAGIGGQPVQPVQQGDCLAVRSFM